MEVSKGFAEEQTCELKPRGRVELNRELGGGPCGQKEEHGYRLWGRRELSELEELQATGVRTRG